MNNNHNPYYQIQEDIPNNSVEMKTYPNMNYL